MKSDIPYKIWPANSDLETVWITARPRKLPRQFSTLVYGVLYHPPGANNRQMLSHITFNLDNILKDYPQTGIVLLGDFNSLPINAL